MFHTKVGMVWRSINNKLNGKINFKKVNFSKLYEDYDIFFSMELF